MTVDGHLPDAIVKIGNVTGSARFIVVEFKSVETRQTVPSAYPDISIVVLDNLGDGITRESVIGGEMMAGGL
jgi:hypothetical protein